MDVDRLMKDLTVEQLENIQGQLQKEVEQKREELREMVGRRYRDVLDASSEVRGVHCLAEQLANAVAATRSGPSAAPSDALPFSSGRSAAHLHRFLALQRLVPLIGTEPSWDAFNDAYALLLAEHLHRQLQTQQSTPSMSSLLVPFGRHLAVSRRQLVSDLLSQLANSSRFRSSLCSDWAVNELAALSMLQRFNTEQLLDTYLTARKGFIKGLLDSSSSLLTIVGECKNTLKVVEELFAHGEMLRVLQAISAPNFRPEVVDDLCRDAAFVCFIRMIGTEAEAVNGEQRERRKETASLLSQTIHDKGQHWIQQICLVARPTVELICEYYESIETLIEFLETLSSVLNEEWPRLGGLAGPLLFYENLFGDVVDQKFKSLLHSSVLSLENSFLDSCSSVPLSDSPGCLFEKRPAKFDPLLATGFPLPLKEAVSTLYSGLSALLHQCTLYEKASPRIGPSSVGEDSSSSIRDTLADSVVDMMYRLVNQRILPEKVSCPLTAARICLALLHSDAAVLCKTLNREGHRISSCSAVLHGAIEKSLSAYACEMARDVLSGSSSLSRFISASSDPLRAVDFALEWEALELPQVGTVHVPVTISTPVHAVLFDMATRLSESSICHLLSRAVRKNSSDAIAKILSKTYTEIVESAATQSSTSSKAIPQRTLIQLLFDCRVLSSLFPLPNEEPKGDAWTEVQRRLEASLDPFDLTLLSPLLSSNTKTAIQRIQLTMAVLLVDILPSKESTSSSRPPPIADLLPRPSEFRPRIPLIPRLDRMAAAVGVSNEKALRGSAAKGSSRHNSLLANSASGSSKASLTSFYDKISSSWFGN